MQLGFRISQPKLVLALIAAHRLVRAMSMIVMSLTFLSQVVMAGPVPAPPQAPDPPPAPDGGSIDAKGPLVAIGAKIIGALLTVAGVATAVVFTAIGVRILIASGMGSSYAVSNGVYALLAAAAGLLLALGGTPLATMIMDAAAGGGLGGKTVIKVPPGAE